jgi:hypothetical protein
MQSRAVQLRRKAVSTYRIKPVGYAFYTPCRNALEPLPKEKRI